jgi:hypothetical protein
VQRPRTWVATLAITGHLALGLACVLVLPRLLYPPLSGTELQDTLTARAHRTPTGPKRPADPAEQLGIADPP